MKPAAQNAKEVNTDLRSKASCKTSRVHREAAKQKRKTKTIQTDNNHNNNNHSNNNDNNNSNHTFVFHLMMS